MSDILLISPDGMLGRAYTELLAKKNLAFDAVSYPQFDITRVEHVERALRPGLRMVINCAAYTDVDGAETHEADALAVNATGVQLVAARCKSIGALLVHYSTDYVFSGEGRSPYRVDEPLDPKNAYGRTKAHGEEAVLASAAEHLILRTSWLYAAWGKNFVDTMAKLGREQPTLRVVNDQRGRPTSARYLAQRSFDLIEKQARGIYHVTDGGECTWYEFASAIVSGTGGTAKVNPCGSDQYVRPAKRPAYSVLDLSRTDALIGPSRPWEENLAAVLRERELAASQGAA
jgi:dTDP-4-dehydrorhamnose reductase